MSGKTETMEFQAESKQLLDLMIHSIYSNKEIFLRELISNASDALDRLRLETLTNPDLIKNGEEFNIRIDIDSESRTLTISDNGIGMTREEVVNNIGTIARSGTRELVEKMKKGEATESASELIGQFGVGFYSAFMAADKVSLITKKAGQSDAILWESNGDGEFTISDTEKDTHGTVITLHLKDSDPENGLEDYSEESAVRNVVKKYSDFISYPIKMEIEREEEVDGDDDKKEKKTIIEDVVLNSMKPIWVKNKNEVEEGEYNEFYRTVSHDWQDPLEVIPIKAEGMIEYQSLLFIPSQAPFDFYYQGYQSGLSLYVKRVKIMDNLEDLLPHYLRFVKGVVETSDLPLNISREILQHDKRLELIKKNITRKITGNLTKMMENENENYMTFWKSFGPAIKEGLTTDYDNKDKLTALILFQSSNDSEKLTSLAEYVERMKEGQENIYYLTGDSRSIMENSPHLEIFAEKGIEVLFLDEPVDELVIQAVNEFDGKKMKSVEKGELELGSEEEKKQAKEKIEEQVKEYGDLIEFIKDKLSDNIKDVRLTNRLVNAPACLVTDDNDMNPHLQKLLKSTNMSMGGQNIKRILELNPEHEIVTKLQTRFDRDKNDPVLNDYSELLMNYAMLSEGGELPDPVRFNQLLVKLMADKL